MNPLPCPFCGEAAGEVAETSTFRWRAWVCGCGVVGPEIRIQTMGKGTPEEWEAAAKVRAIEAWNTRATPNAGDLNLCSGCGMPLGKHNHGCPINEADQAPQG